VVFWNVTAAPAVRIAGVQRTGMALAQRVL
jgi:hypothetical protein